MRMDKLPPWQRNNPGDAKAKPLTPEQKAAAMERAERAGRPYPNLIDNMWAARRKKSPGEHRE